MRTHIACLFALACAIPIGAHAQRAYHDNVVIVLDGSGSMGADMSTMNVTKMKAAKDALKKVLVQVPDSTHVGLLVFSRRHRDPWLYPLGPRDEKGLVAAIDSVDEGGGTPLGEHMKIGADRLLDERETQFGYGTYKLLVVTDGEAGDQNLVNTYTPDILSRGITVDVIGVDMQGDHTLATKVNSYRRADDPAALTDALSRVFAEVSYDGGDAAAESEFELLEGLPIEVAAAMLTKLAAPADAPIGSAKSTDESQQDGARSATRPDTAPQPIPVPQPDSGDGGFSLAPMFIIAIVVAMLVITKRRRRR